MCSRTPDWLIKWAVLNIVIKVNDLNALRGINYFRHRIFLLSQINKNTKGFPEHHVVWTTNEFTWGLNCSSKSFTVP
jgi:hypothetical protein